MITGINAFWVPSICLVQEASFALSLGTFSLSEVPPCMTVPTWWLRASTWPTLDPALCSTTPSNFPYICFSFFFLLGGFFGPPELDCLSLFILYITDSIISSAMPSTMALRMVRVSLLKLASKRERECQVM